MTKCNKCGSSHIKTERRPDGISECMDCGYKWKGNDVLTNFIEDTETIKLLEKLYLELKLTNQLLRSDK